MNKNELDRHITGNWGEDSVKYIICPNCTWEGDEDDLDVGDLESGDPYETFCPECGEIIE